MPEAANLASIPPPAACSGGIIGVSGGGGDPRWALVVDTDEVEPSLLTPDEFGTLSWFWASTDPGGGQYCWW